MLIDFANGQTSIVVRVKLRNSSVTTGAGLTGLTNASSGLKIAATADNEATATAYTVAGSNVETITTLGTYEAPSASKCRFKEVDATNHPGVYEIHLANARFAVSGAKSLLVSISGATNLAECDIVIPLRTVNPYATNGKLPVTLASTDVTGNVACDLQTIKTQAVTCGAGVTVLASVGTAATSTAQTGDVADVLTRLTALRAGYLDNLATAPPTASTIAAAILVTPGQKIVTDASGYVTAGTVEDKTGYGLASDGVDLIVVESGLNLRQAASLIAAGIAGGLSGAGTGTVIIKGAGVATTRITAQTDNAGNRTSLILNVAA